MAVSCFRHLGVSVAGVMTDSGDGIPLRDASPNGAHDLKLQHLYTRACTPLWPYGFSDRLATPGWP